jgi:hypothetical protein
VNCQVSRIHLWFQGSNNTVQAVPYVLPHRFVGSFRVVAGEYVNKLPVKARRQIRKFRGHVPNPVKYKNMRLLNELDQRSAAGAFRDSYVELEVEILDVIHEFRVFAGIQPAVE